MKMIWMMAAALVSAAAVNGSAMGQQAAEQQDESVEVIAPYVVNPEPGKPARGMNRDAMRLMKVDKAVSFRDLDLTKPEDQATLKTRVKQAAQASCGYLEQRYPHHPEQDCLKAATDEAMIQVNALITAANTK